MSVERAGTPGRHWDTVLVTAEVVVDTDDGESPFGWREPEPPTPNRATRRAMQRAARRKQ
ncbi:hypothetical protein ACIRQH_34855 [Streptomyces sp. NPDC102279]|uniref:hypothetical protein n=1 Tax=Streptomyces sp. NPDC102279 TaxID=3366153 RepID=UPI00382ECAD7